MAKDESRRDRWVKASQRLRNAFQMAAVSCYNTRSSVPAGGCCGHHVDTVQHDYRRCLWRVGRHLHHRGSDCGCGGAVGADDLPQ